MRFLSIVFALLAVGAVVGSCVAIIGGHMLQWFLLFVGVLFAGYAGALWERSRRVAHDETSGAASTRAAPLVHLEERVMGWDGPERYSVHFLCEVHGKETHPTRWSAKHAARCVHDRGIREYRCSVYPGWWHNGHMPPSVRRGEMTMDEWWSLPNWKRRQLMTKEQRAQLERDQSGRNPGAVRGVEALGNDPGGAGAPGGHDAGNGVAVPAGGEDDGLAGLDGGPIRLGAGLRHGGEVHQEGSPAGQAAA